MAGNPGRHPLPHPAHPPARQPPLSHRAPARVLPPSAHHSCGTRRAHRARASPGATPAHHQHAATAAHALCRRPPGRLAAREGERRRARLAGHERSHPPLHAPHQPRQGPAPGTLHQNRTAGIIMALVLTFVIILLLISALLCAVETALLCASRARLHQHAQKGDARATVALDLLKNTDQMLAAILIVMTIIPVVCSALVAGVALQQFGPTGAAWATAALGLFIVLVVEAFPKALGSRFPDAISLTFARPMRLSMLAMLPVTLAIKAFNTALLTLMGLRTKQGAAFTEADIRGAINLGLEHGALAPTQHRMLDAVLDLNELTVQDVMVHRSAIAGMDINTPPQQIPQVLGDLRHSRVIAFEGARENIIGILYVRDYLTALAAVETRREVQLKDHLRPLYFVPETTPVGHQLLEFLRLHRHLALVVDEYGDVQGLITLEDILEEIVGDIADEHEARHPTGAESLQPDGSYILPGNTPVRDANRTHKWRLPEGEAITLAGLLVEHFRRLPAQGESIELGGLTLTVAGKRGHRIETIRVAPKA
ncbi:MAG: DUF21 domain-containing protein [Proteobacteria bacterium]|nr:DUF21 domain-containing protein [Pseudomonadota bacterium]